MSRKRQRPADFKAGEQGTNPYLKAAILEVVEKQLRENNPPKIQQTPKRLLAAGYTRQTASELIGSAVVEEFWQMLHERKPFDPVRYKRALDKLGQQMTEIRIPDQGIASPASCCEFGLQ